MLTPVSTNTMTITIAKAITNYNDYNNKKDFNNNNNFYNKKYNNDNNYCTGNFKYNKLQEALSKNSLRLISSSNYFFTDMVQKKPTIFITCVSLL